MNVKDYIYERIKKEKVHMGLIDPDEQKPERASELARALEDARSDAIMVGGSTGFTKRELDETVKNIKGAVDLPVILFPTSAGAISGHADAIYFMSMLNSRDLERVVGEQVAGAPLVKKLGLEPISMAYLIVEPGMTAGEVGKADLIPRDDPQEAVNYALTAEYLGMDFIYLEAGSGAPDPVPPDMVKAVEENTELSLIVGGGIRKDTQAKTLTRAGADIIVTGTVLEETEDKKNKIEGLISAIKM